MRAFFQIFMYLGREIQYVQNLSKRDAILRLLLLSKNHKSRHFLNAIETPSAEVEAATALSLSLFRR